MSYMNNATKLMSALLALTSVSAMAGSNQLSINTLKKQLNSTQHTKNQQGNVCGTDTNLQDWNQIQKNNKFQLENKLSKANAVLQKLSNSSVDIQAAAGNGIAGRYYIPVVFHVYGNEFNCTDESAMCLTEAKILDGLNRTNEDFLGTNTLDGPIAAEFQAIRDNLNIEFVLAKKDPNGNPTNGIVRHGAKSGYGDGSKFDSEISADAWDNFKYMNIYIQQDLYNDGTTSSSGVAWYPELNMSQAGLSRVVYNGNFLGKNSSENFRSVFTHEFGHWLNLPHTFDGDVCSVHQEAFCAATGDNNCDTPQMSSSILQNNALNCLGQPTNTENFMHYSDNYAMYTAGQVQRMTAALHGPARATLWSNENLIATGLSDLTSTADHYWDGSGLDIAPTGSLITEVTNLSAAKGNIDNHVVNIPSGTEAVAFYLDGYTEDPDMYVSKGSVPAKNGDTWTADYISFKSKGVPELVTVSAPSSTLEYNTTVDAFTAYSNARLQILAVDDETLCNGCERVFLAEETNLSAKKGDAVKTYQYQVPSDATRTVVVIAGGYTGDPDMYASINSVPDTTTFDCGPFSAPRLSEFCELNAGGGELNVMIEPFLDYSNATFRVYYERSLGSDLPLAEANGAYTAILGQKVIFSSAGTTDTNGSIQSYLWDFGDGNTSNLANPEHTYATTGSFTATLTVIDNDSNTASDTANVIIQASNEAPVAQINGPYSAVSGQEITMNSNGSVDPDGAIVTYLWHFGDGNTSSQPNPKHTYAASGDYTVTLSVTDNGGLTATATTNASITDISYCSASGNTGYEWIANVSSSGVSHASSQEGYADNTSVIIPMVIGNNPIALTAGGNYTEYWTAWVDLNEDGTFTNNEKLLSGLSGKNQVTASITMPSSLAGKSARMRIAMKYGSAATNPCGNIGDGEVEDYTVTVGSATNQAPVANANGSYTATLGDSVNFNGSGSTDADGSIATYAWNFGDANSSDNTSAAINPTHIYTSAGSYTVTLTVTDNQGASHTDTADVTISPKIPTTNLVDACATKNAVTSGRLENGVAACLGNASTMWFSIPEVNNHQKIAITTGHGQGNLDILYKNGGWPSTNSNDASASGSTTTCIDVAAGTNYWSYLKVSGGASGSTIIVDMDATGCR